MDYVYLLGQLTLALIVALLAAFLFLTALVAIFLRTGKAYFPGLLVFLATALESPLKAVLKLSSIDGAIVDQMLIEMRNRLARPAFSAVPASERFLFLPQCLRNVKCPAKLTTEGVQCINCGLCAIKDMKAEAEKLGYRVFIVTGSSMVKRIILAQKPKAIFGVACMPEVKMGLELCDKFRLPSQGLPLMKAGCVSTVVDADALLEALSYGTGNTALMPAPDLS